MEAHQRLGVIAVKIDLKQASTKKGLALIGAGVALATGHLELLTTSVTPESVQVGGLDWCSCTDFGWFMGINTV